MFIFELRYRLQNSGWVGLVVVSAICLRMITLIGLLARRPCHPATLSGTAYCLLTLNFHNPSKSVQISSAKHFPLSRSECALFEQSIEELLKRFLLSNLKTGNFASLVQVIALRHSELKNSVLTENRLFIWQVMFVLSFVLIYPLFPQTCNALFIVRTVIRFMAERIKEEVSISESSIH